MAYEAARLRASQLNAQSKIERQANLKVARIAERVELDQLHHSAFIPKELNEQFLKWLEENVRSSKMKSHWGTAKKIIIQLQLRSEDFASSRGKILRYFETQEYSLHYVKKLLRMMNLYGEFVSRLTGLRYEKIALPRGIDAERINDAYMDSDSYFGPSEPLTLNLLEEIRGDLPERQASWLEAALWFGLRPSELEMILEDRAQARWRVEEDEIPILWVYQPKLTSKPRNQRWKGIPCIFPEQEAALAILAEARAERPLPKTLKKYSGIQLTLYCGRKGFTDLMMSKGQRLDHISQWLGHTTINTTLKSYKDKRQVHWTAVSK